MPRRARIDAPGAVHHIIIRGIERSPIFRDDKDRDGFLQRLALLISESQTVCFAWALMPNHAHLLLRTGKRPIATIMRRLLTGHAVSFNRRHDRHGHLFQNRYKSILCDEDCYLKQLVAYIHLNPLRAGLVPDVSALRKYAYTGHSALAGQVTRAWQDTQSVLRHFGRTLREANRNLHNYVLKWAEKGRCPELTGGGMIRSAGGWQQVKESRRDQIRLTSDERILGSSEFVEKVLENAEEPNRFKLRSRAGAPDLTALVRTVAEICQVEAQEVSGRLKRPEIARSRALAAYLATHVFGYSGADIARTLNIDRSAIGRMVQKVSTSSELQKDARKIVDLLTA